MFETLLIISLILLGGALLFFIFLVIEYNHGNEKAVPTMIITSILIVFLALITAISYDAVKNQIYTRAINAYQIGDVYQTPDGTWHQMLVDYD